MAQGWEALGSALTGNAAGNEMAYLKGQSLGANTQAALAKARESNATEAAKMQLSKQVAAIPGVTPQLAAAAQGIIQSGGTMQDLVGALLKNQEMGQRAIAADQSRPFSERNAALLPLSNAPIERYGTAGEGYQQDKLSDLGPQLTGVGQSVIGKNNAAAALDNAKAANPTSGNPYLVVNGVPFLKPTAQGGALTVAPGFTDATAQGAISTTNANVAGAKKAGATVATNATALPAVLNDLNNMTSTVDKLLASPGFDKIYGHLQGTGVGQSITQALSQDASDADAIRKQLGSQSFGVAIQKMRGLGALSNAEGTKVESALTRLTNARIGSDEARTAAAELKQAVQNLKNAAIQEAGGEDKLSQILNGGTVTNGAPAAGALQSGSYSHLWE